MGCPPSGTAVYICSLNAECIASATGKMTLCSLARPTALETTVYNCTHLFLTWLPPELAPKEIPCADEVSPAKVRGRSPLKDKASPLPVSPGCGADFAKKFSSGLSEGQGMSSLTARRSAWACLAEGGEQVRTMLQNFALRWLSDRFILPGSPLVLPICGCDCVFSVSAIEYSFPLQGQPNRTQKLSLDGLPRSEKMAVTELPSPLTVFHVSKGTRVTLSPVTTDKVAKDEGKHLQTQSDKSIASENSDVKYSDLGGLSEQIQALRDIVELPLLQPNLYAR